MVRTRGPVPDGLHYWNISQIVPGVAVQDTRNHLDHYMVLGYLRGETAKDLTGYLPKACRFPLQPLCHDLAFDPDKLFSELKN